MPAGNSSKQLWRHKDTAHPVFLHSKAKTEI